MGTRLLNHHIKKGNMVVVMMDLDQNLYSPKQQLCMHHPDTNTSTGFSVFSRSILLIHAEFI